MHGALLGGSTDNTPNQHMCKQLPTPLSLAAFCVLAVGCLSQGVPKFKAPWQAVRILMDRQLVLHVFVILLGYSLYIITLAVLPFYLAKPPYSLSTDSIGAAYLPGALAAIVASPCGGRLADLSARPNPRQPLRRLVYANVLMLLLMPVSLVVWGWGLQAGLHLAIPLAACFMASFVNSLYMPGLFTVSVSCNVVFLLSSAAGGSVLTATTHQHHRCQHPLTLLHNSPLLLRL